MARDLKPCGTTAAYARHLRYGQIPCDKCRAAQRERSAAARRELAALREDRRLATQRRAVLAAAVYTGQPRRGVQRARQAERLRGEL